MDYSDFFTYILYTVFILKINFMHIKRQNGNFKELKTLLKYKYP